MGHAESKERLLFIDIVKHMINGRGIKVTNKQLTQFFQFVQEQCPWFPEQGTVNIETWQKVGQTLQVYYSHFGPEKVPVDTFTLWNLIRESIAPLPEGQKNPYKYPTEVMDECTPLLSSKTLKDTKVLAATLKDCNLDDKDSEEENESPTDNKFNLLKNPPFDDELPPADQDDLDAAAYDYERRKYEPHGAFSMQETKKNRPKLQDMRPLGRLPTAPPAPLSSSVPPLKRSGHSILNVGGLPPPPPFKAKGPPPPPPFNNNQGKNKRHRRINDEDDDYAFAACFPVIFEDGFDDDDVYWDPLPLKLLKELKKAWTANFFVAMLSLLSVQVSANGTYWAYFPDPPILHTCTWKDFNIPVTSSFPELTDGIRGVQGYKQFVINFNYSFTGQTDFPPICFFLDSGSIGGNQTKNGCLSVVDAGFLTDSPKRPKKPTGKDKITRYLWSLLGKVIGQNQVFVNKSLAKVVHPPKYDDCDEIIGEATNEWIWIDIKTGYPSWIYCMYNKENKISIPGTKYYISDWSSNFPEGDYRTYLQKGLLYPWNDSYIPRPLKVNRWNSHGWVAPIYIFVYENKTYYQSQLWRLPLTTRKIMLIRATTHAEEYYVQTCVTSPYSLLLSNDSEKLQIMQYNMRFYITCQQCILTTCIVPEMNVSTIMVLKRPAYIMLPVALNESWYTDIGAEIIRQVGELIRPKRFVATLILGISALIGILSSFTVATYTLVKEVQTAQYANDLSKNISLALATQEIIDRKLEAKVDALEEAVLHIGQELTALKICLSLTCHKKYSWICVTPLKVNYSEYSWEQIQMHILNVWNFSDMGIDLEHLHKQIYDIAASQYDMNPSKAAAEFL
ncbi:endogenous retrovirus group K member 25 Env polyprotein-like [Globicephala melas]|uniref:endogenous retrovirus group K member 25 Env polyprotein-like n=1 Tax=Globicephala melas TaxID=9731 RepID=UPI00387310B4